ncbi:MAG: rhodanese-like domain-containing protein [Candidatus Neomarinimicrobiota bacterium]
MKFLITIIIFLTMAAIFGCKSYFSPKNINISLPVITVEELRARIKQGSPIMLDVRTPAEFNGVLGHVPGSFQIPLHELENRLEELELYRKEEIILICRSGNRSQKAAGILINHNFKALNMLGGMRKWNSTP